MTEEHASFEGTIERRKVLAGTRSEREAPVLVTTGDDGAERVVRVHIVGDESFVDAALDAYVGKRVRVGPGEWRNRVLRVEASAIELLGVSDATPSGEGAR